MKSSYHCPSLKNNNDKNGEVMPRSMSTMQNSFANANELIESDAYADPYIRTPNVELKTSKTNTISHETFVKNNKLTNKMQLI